MSPLRGRCDAARLACPRLRRATVATAAALAIPDKGLPSPLQELEKFAEQVALPSEAFCAERRRAIASLDARFRALPPAAPPPAAARPEEDFDQAADDAWQSEEKEREERTAAAALGGGGAQGGEFVIEPIDEDGEERPAGAAAPPAQESTCCRCGTLLDDEAGEVVTPSVGCDAGGCTRWACLACAGFRSEAEAGRETWFCPLHAPALPAPRARNTLPAALEPRVVSAPKPAGGLAEKRLRALVARLSTPGAAAELLLAALAELGPVPVTVELLRATGVGRAVNAVRKEHEGGAVAEAATALLQRWRGLAQARAALGAGSSTDAARSGSDAASGPARAELAQVRAAAPRWRVDFADPAPGGLRGLIAAALRGGPLRRDAVVQRVGAIASAAGLERRAERSSVLAALSRELRQPSAFWVSSGSGADAVWALTEVAASAPPPPAMPPAAPPPAVPPPAAPPPAAPPPAAPPPAAFASAEEAAVPAPSGAGSSLAHARREAMERAAHVLANSRAQVRRRARYEQFTSARAAAVARAEGSEGSETETEEEGEGEEGGAGKGAVEVVSASLVAVAGEASATPSDVVFADAEGELGSGVEVVCEACTDSEDEEEWADSEDERAAVAAAALGMGPLSALLPGGGGSAGVQAHDIDGWQEMPLGKAPRIYDSPRSREDSSPSYEPG